MGWDETIPDNIQRQWAKWKRQLKELEGLSVDRCFKPANFGKIVDCSLHHFADACENAYDKLHIYALLMRLEEFIAAW